MDMADRFGLPVVTLVDTPGAYEKVPKNAASPEAIARSTQKCLQLKVPLVSVIIGEGGSGGVAFATANRVAMLQHSVYSVISPEGCASIPKDARSGGSRRLTAQNLKELGVCDMIINEPVGGAHRNKKAAITDMSAAINTMLETRMDAMSG
jgi:acetyl-CoA carboxylase carboxyl transferase subunit alpha